MTDKVVVRAITPSDRLAALQRLKDCRVCAALETLSPDLKAGWVEAIANITFEHGAVAALLMEDLEAGGYRGLPIGKDSIVTHRRRNH